MSLEENIVNFQFTEEEEIILRNYLNTDKFLEKAKSVVISSADVYSTSIEKAKKAVLRYPEFATLNHKRVLTDLILVYGEKNKDKLKEISISNPPFAGLNHTRVLTELLLVYGDENKAKIMRAILTHPPFAGYDHNKAFQELLLLYGIENGEKLKKSIK